MDKLIHLSVTPEDIKFSIPGNPEQCAIATALKRVTGAPFAKVGFGVSWTMPNGECYHASLNKEEMRFMADFDYGTSRPITIALTPYRSPLEPLNPKVLANVAALLRTQAKPISTRLAQSA